MQISDFELIVLGARYTVKTVDPKTEELEWGGNLGTRDSEANIIYLSNKMSPRKWWEVLVHEAVHAADSELDAKLTEAQVSTLATVIISLLDHNRILRSSDHVPDPKKNFILGNGAMIL